MTRGSQDVTRQLAPHPASVGEGRRFIRDLLTANSREHLLDAAELLVSEFVTNALVHAGTVVELVARLDGGGVRVEVRDGSPHLPATKNYADLAATGRGLQLVEHMVDRWGVDPHERGKTVWFELGIRAGEDLGQQMMKETAGPETAVAPGEVVVELLNFPLLLHGAWQMQAESLLREYLLSQLDAENGTAQIEQHAEAADALALLREQVPAPELGADPDALMAAAVEPRVSAARLVLTVPRDSVPRFRLLHEMLSTAIELADAGLLLTPPTQPEVQALRRWMCAEVEGQATGRGPEPWDPDIEDPTPPRAPAPWDPTVVLEATGAVLAADDTNRILAVSAPALALLGYDDPVGLVGRRLVEIIPHRYRQAHLAGFTLHLFTDRSPLLGTSVVLPALRRDGSEVAVRLTVRAHLLPRDRKVFIAELDAA